jgi:hypothetical protein
MGRSPLGRARLITTIGGIALLIVMFLPWFGVGGPGVERADELAPSGTGAPEFPDANAWQAFGFIDVVLVATGLVAIAPALVFLVAGIKLPPIANALAAGLGILATLLVLYRLISPPEWFVVAGSEVPGFELEASREAGVFLGLIASAAVAVGGGLATREERIALGLGRRPALGRPPGP